MTDNKPQRVVFTGDLAMHMQQAQAFAEGYCKKPERFRHSLYKESVDYASEIRIHFEYAEKPTEAHDFLHRQRPNEANSIKEYRLKMYEPVTASLMSKPLTFLARLFNPSLSGINFEVVDDPQVQAEEDLESYLTELLPGYGSLTEFLKDEFIKFLISDPNGWVAVRTIRPDSALSPDELPEPMPYCIPSRAVVNYSRTFLITHSDEKSMVREYEGGPLQEKGEILYFYFKDFTLRATQYGNRANNQFFVEVWNDHKLGFLPATQNGGLRRSFKDRAEVSDPHRIFYSFFQPAIPYLNVMAGLYNDQQAAFVTRIFLQKYEKATTCPKCKGSGQVQPTGLFTSPKMVTCEACDGHGKMLGGSPFSTYVESVKPGDAITPPAGYISIPTDIVNLVEQKIEQTKYDALSAIHLESLLKNQSLAESGESKRQDRDAMYALLEAISMALFDRHGQRIADAVSGIRYATVLGTSAGENRAVMKKPHRFDIIAMADSIMYANSLKGLSAPGSLLKPIVIQIAREQFGANSLIVRMVEAELRLDPLAMTTEDQLLSANAAAGQRVTDRLAAVKHLYASQIIQGLVNEDPGFLDLAEPDQEAKFTAAAEAMMIAAPEPDEDPVLDIIKN